MAPNRRDLLALAAGAVLLPTATPAPAAQHRTLFGSPVELLLPAAAPRAASDEVWRGLTAMNARWNAWKPGDLRSVNEAFRAGRAVAATPMLVAMIRSAALLEAASFGLFNPAAGGLVGAWGFHADDLRPGPRPSARQLAGWVDARPSLAQIEIRGHDLYTPNPRLQLDFGAYAKGVAIDWALDRLRRHGVHDAMLNLGGNLATMGRAGGRPWRIGIRDPQGPGLAAAIDTAGREAVVTSGSYERWRLAGGERVTHILDPLTGVPARDIASVTVVHPSAALADAAATALLVAGRERWHAVAARMGVDQVLLIDDRGRQQASPRLAPRCIDLR